MRHGEGWLPFGSRCERLGVAPSTRTHPLPFVARPEGFPCRSARDQGALAETLQERKLLCAARLNRRSLGRTALGWRLLQRLLKRGFLFWLRRLVLRSSEKHPRLPRSAACLPLEAAGFARDWGSRAAPVKLEERLRLWLKGTYDK